VVLLINSFYNLFFPSSNNDYYLFNSLHGKIFLIDKKLKEALASRNFDGINKNVLMLLKKHRIVIEYKEKELFKRLYEAKRSQAKKLIIAFSPSYKCNLNCPYCFEKKELRKIKSSRTAIKKIIKFIRNKCKEKTCKQVVFILFGGEPILEWENSLKLIKKAKEIVEKHKKKFVLEIFSNAVLIDKKIIQSLKPLNVKNIQVSLDGDKLEHDKRRNIKGKSTYNKITRVLKQLKESKIPFVIRINIDKKNLYSINNLLDDLVKRGLKGMKLSFGSIIKTGGASSSYPYFLKRKDSLKILPYMWKKALQKGFKINETKPFPTYIFCGAFSFNNFVFDPHARVYTCWSLQGMPEYSVGKIDPSGNFMKNEFYDKWHKRNPFSIKKCRECKMLPLCGGGCAALSIEEFNDFRKPSCFFYSKKLLAEKIRIYASNKNLIKIKSSGFL